MAYTLYTYPLAYAPFKAALVSCCISDDCCNLSCCQIGAVTHGFSVEQSAAAVELGVCTPTGADHSMAAFV
jgi:hypothetical protein